MAPKRVHRAQLDRLLAFGGLQDQTSHQGHELTYARPSRQSPARLPLQDERNHRLRQAEEGAFARGIGKRRGTRSGDLANGELLADIPIVSGALEGAGSWLPSTEVVGGLTPR